MNNSTLNTNSADLEEKISQYERNVEKSTKSYQATLRIIENANYCLSELEKQANGQWEDLLNLKLKLQELTLEKAKQSQPTKQNHEQGK